MNPLNRESFTERALARKIRRLIAERDAAILVRAGVDVDFDALAEYVTRTAFDLD